VRRPLILVVRREKIFSRASAGFTPASRSRLREVPSRNSFPSPMPGWRLRAGVFLFKFLPFWVAAFRLSPFPPSRQAAVLLGSRGIGTT
jgi:hypothetical protein